MNSPQLATLMIGIGIILLVLAPWLPAIAPAQAVWTDDDARAYSQAAAELHHAQHAQGHQHPPAAQSSKPPSAEPAGQELPLARAEFAKQQIRLDAARARLGTARLVCQALGILLAGTGVGMYLLARAKVERQ